MKLKTIKTIKGQPVEVTPEHAALLAVAAAAKELLMFGSFSENGTRADEAAKSAHCALSKLAAVRDLQNGGAK